MAQNAQKIKLEKPSNLPKLELVDSKDSSLSFERIVILDLLRGLAIVAMVAYHVNFDLIKLFGLRDYLGKSFWSWGAEAIGGSFLFVSGVSLSIYLNLNPPQNSFYKKFKKRLLILVGISLTITAVTYLLFPKKVVLFGIIHLIAVCTILSPIIYRLKLKWIYLIVLVSITSKYWASLIPINDPWLFWLWGKNYPFPKMLDCWPVLTYSWSFFLGMAIGKRNHLWELAKNYNKWIEGTKMANFLAWMGRRSLLIYLIHQPILILIIWLVFKINNSFL